MSRYHPKQGRQGEPRVTMHLEALTDSCVCPRLDGCGGIVTVLGRCPEHGVSSNSVLGKFHTHPAQVDKINPGRHIA